MAVVVTYSDNTFVVTGGTEGTPATMEDVYTYAYDNSLYVGGEEVVESPEVGNYTVRASIDFGNGTDPTYFTSKDGEQVYGIDGVYFANKANATLQLGSKVNSQSGMGACWNFQIKDDWSNTFCLSGSILKVYGSLVIIRGLTKNASIYETEIKQSIFASTGGWIVFSSASTDIAGQVYFYGNVFRIIANPSNLEDIHCHYVSYGIVATWTGATLTVRNMKFTGISTADVLAGGSSGSNLNVVSPITPLGTVRIDTVEDAWIKEQYMFNIYIRDKEGANLGTVTCLLEDTDGNTIFSVSTAGDGTITEQTVTYKKWEGTDETLTAYTPHKLTLTKDGYEPIIIPNITMDEDKDLEYRLLPALAVGDVRFDTDFGESKTGTLPYACHIFGGIIVR